MDIFLTLYHTLLYQPIFNALVLLYQYLPVRDFGVAVIVLTVLFRILLYPLSAKATEAQKRLSALQPKLKEIQEKFKNNRDAQMRATLELYRKENVNPFATLIPLLIQFPVLIALYRVFWNGLDPAQLSNLYNFVQSPGEINPTFLGILNLSSKSLPVAIIAGILQFLQTKQITQPTQKKESSKQDFASALQTHMLYVFPLVTAGVLATLPSAVGIYWIATSAFSIWQQWNVMKKFNRQSAQSSTNDKRTELKTL